MIILVSLDKSSVEGLLPEQLSVAGDPVQAAIWVARYPFSTLGPYSEALIAISVLGPGGSLGYYIPYIYVDNDAALAAGREVLGAPKKFAKITLGVKGFTVYGLVERNGSLIARAWSKLEARVAAEMIKALLPEKLTMYGLRLLPSVGGNSVAQLVEWYVATRIRENGFGVDAWTGPGRVELYSSLEDPLGELHVVQVIGGFYVRLDMELGVNRVLWEGRL